MSFEVVKDNYKDVLKRIEALTSSEVLIGVPDSTADREGDGPISNAGIGYVMEFGSPSMNIPERPFLIPGVSGMKDEIAKRLRSAAKKALDGDRKAISEALEALGLLGQSKVRQKITDGPFAPLAEATIKARERRGVTRTKPLIDTGQLRNSITYVVRKRKVRK